MLKAARKDLARSGITPEEAEEAGIYATRDARAELGPAFQPLPAIVIPYPDPFTGDLIQYEDRDGEPADFFRVRYLEKPEAPGKGWDGGKFQRYAQPPKSGVHPYFPALDDLDWSEVLADPSESLIVTEGEKKSLRACLAGYNCLGLGGVYNFLSASELLPILDSITWKGRKVYICYDSDSANNPDIQSAEARLAGELVKRGAHVRIVRMPNAADDSKQGVDDFLEDQGEAAFANLIAHAESNGRVGRVQEAVLRMNERCAWIAQDGAVWDFSRRRLIPKKDFTSGDDLSAIAITVPAARAADGVKEVQVSPKFLVSPLARRYDAVVCDPTTTEAELKRDGRLVYNTFQGFNTKPGDVSDWLTLTRYIFKELDDPDFAVRLFSYKAQNPNEKIPLAFVIVGSHQGSGKSLWGKMLELAFAPYAASLDAKVLTSDYTAWLENKLLILYDEAQPQHVAKGAEKLKQYISERAFWFNQKYIPQRESTNLATFILTANNLDAGSFEGEDRRMIVVNAPNPRVDPIPDKGIFERLYGQYDNRHAGAEYGHYLMHFFLNYDLQGWKPPQRAPETETKVIQFEDNLSEAERIAWKIVEGRYRFDPVVDWCDAAMVWAQENLDSVRPDMRQQAETILDTLPSLAVRPFYTAEELLTLLPRLVDDRKVKADKATPAGALSKLFRQQGVPVLKLKNKRRPIWRGEETTFLIVSNDPKDQAPVDQDYFDSLMRNAPRYADVIRERKKS